MHLNSWRTWMRPGMVIKRWLALFVLGVICTSLSIAMALAWLFRSVDLPAEASGVVRGVTLQFLAHPFRELVLLAIGGITLGFATWRMGESLLSPLLARVANAPALAQILAEHRFGTTPLRSDLVAIGGGTGLSTLLRGIKHADANVTAIVTVADDGGSTGRLRREFDIPAVGDLRNCIVALADDETTVGQLFQYRFNQAGSSLSGHSFGNLYMAALAEVTGSFEQAIMESGRVLAIRGRVLPSTLENITLCAEMIDGSVVIGESAIASETTPIKRVFMAPERPAGYEPALTAILNAKLIVLGPGSLYTSVLPNLMVRGVSEAIQWSRGKVVYVCNVATQPGETDHFGVADHVAAVNQHLGPGGIDYVLVNTNTAGASAIQQEWNVDPVQAEDAEAISRRVGVECCVISCDLVDDSNPLRHDPAKLAAALLDIEREPQAAAPAMVTRSHLAVGKAR